MARNLPSLHHRDTVRGVTRSITAASRGVHKPYVGRFVGFFLIAYISYHILLVLDAQSRGVGCARPVLSVFYVRDDGDGRFESERPLERQVLHGIFDDR